MSNSELSVNLKTSILPINQLKVELEDEIKPEINGEKRDVRSDRFQSRDKLDKKLRIVTPDGRKLLVSPRFWRSFSNALGVSRNIFDLFDYNEVFQRIADRRSENIRICSEIYTEENGYAHGKLLSCTNPNKPLLTVDNVNELVQKYEGYDVTYKEGQVTAMFDCPYPMEFSVGDSGFQTKFNLVFPVDGYGMPASYLTLLRLVCTNGMVGMNTAFKTSFQLGSNDSNLMSVLDRAIESFNDEEGFHAFRERVEAAQNSWASLYNYATLMRALNAGLAYENCPTEKRVEVTDRLNAISGNPPRLFGFTSGNEPSPRFQKTFPIRCTVYDLLNFASEVSTHTFKQQPARNRVNAWVGEVLASEYDLENTKDTFEDFADFFMEDHTKAFETATS